MRRPVVRLRLLFLAAAGLILLSGPVATPQSPDSSVRERQTTSRRRVFVHSTSLLVGNGVVEDKLLKQREFKQLGFVITRDVSDADLVLELRHDVLTKYVFTVVDAKNRTVLAAGKLSSIGGTVAEKVAKRFIKEMTRAGMT